MQKITPFLWFNDNIEEAVNYYTSLFSNSEIVHFHRYGEGGPKPSGKVMTGTFKLCGQEFYALDGGPMFTFTPALSFFVYCDTIEETDALWEGLSAGGKILMELDKYAFSDKYGWVQDKFGISWQLSLGSRKQKISPFFLFTGKQFGRAGEAVDFYSKTFASSSIVNLVHTKTGDNGEKEILQYGVFTLQDELFMAMDSGESHNFSFSPAISLFVNCESQEEVDRFWDILSEGGEKSRCGWLIDKFGVSWQIIPSILGKLLYTTDSVKSGRVMQAMMQMSKIDIKALQNAYDQS